MGAGEQLTRWLAVLAVGCAAGNPEPAKLGFRGVETEAWLAYEVGGVARDDLLPAFEAGARNYGCRTEQIGADSSATLGGERRSYYGIDAACEEGEIALITLVDARVRIGCARPTTRDRCDLLLRKISEAR